MYLYVLFISDPLFSLLIKKPEVLGYKSEARYQLIPMPCNQPDLGSSSSMAITVEGSLPYGGHGSELELGKMCLYSGPVCSFRATEHRRHGVNSHY
jgi:hypothetical protein